MVPSSWKHRSSRSMCVNLQKHSCSMITYLSGLLPHCWPHYWKKKRSMIPNCNSLTLFMNFMRVLPAHIQQVCLFMYSSKRKWILSLKMVLSPNESPGYNALKINWQTVKVANNHKISTRGFFGSTNEEANPLPLFIAESFWKCSLGEYNAELVLKCFG